jgi:membrane associated rhomboid family serine protease
MQLAAFAVIGFAVDIYFIANRGDGVAYGAHAGGFLSGVVIAALVTTIYPSEKEYERSALKR